MGRNLPLNGLRAFEASAAFDIEVDTGGYWLT